jgi:Site-specific recombinase XerD
VRLYLKPALGKVPLAKLQTEHVARMIQTLTARSDLSSTTVRYAGVVLRIALTRAVKSGKVQRNVATLADLPAKAKPEIAPLSSGQISEFLEATRTDRFGPLFVAAIATGLRQGELLALRWQDIDMDGASLSVRHSLQIRSRVLAEPKTENAKRTLRIGTEVISVLREQRRRQILERMAAGPAWKDGGFVFTTSVGTPLDSRNLTRAFQAALALAGLPRQRFHDLRHATATLLLERGEELGVVSKVLGHSTVTTTLDTYGHLTSGMSQRVADRMDVIVRRPASGA